VVVELEELVAYDVGGGERASEEGGGLEVRGVDGLVVVTGGEAGEEGGELVEVGGARWEEVVSAFDAAERSARGGGG